VGRRREVAPGSLPIFILFRFSGATRSLSRQWEVSWEVGGKSHRDFLNLYKRRFIVFRILMPEERKS
jgi:hypothetical protein